MRVSIMLCLLLLAACSSEAPPPPPPEPAPKRATVLDEQLKALDTAKSLQQMEEERLRKMDEQINGQSSSEQPK